MKVYDMAWDAGFRTFDTAHSYGNGEAVLGEWLSSRNHRAEAVILDKGCNPGQKGSDAAKEALRPETIRAQLELSLRRLRTDHVDLYLLHQPVNVFPLVTPSSMPHMVDNVRALDIRLTAAQCQWLDVGDA